MTLTPRAESEQRRFIDLWKKAEEDIKLCERIETKLLIPSINELRYAGTHHIRALRASDEDEQLEELGKAKKHCLRASYDAIEMVIIHELERVSAFLDDYRHVEITSTLPDFADLRKKAREARRILSAAQQGDSREQYYDKLRPYIDETREVADRMDDAREELNKRMRKDNQSARFQIAALILAALTVFVTWWVAR